jgi:hypothetical protein
MKNTISLLCTALLLAGSLALRAEDAPKAKPGSAEFERMKTLVGAWHGKADMGQGPVDMDVQYRLLAGGSVLEERVFAGTPNEMVTMFYDKEGKLALTHYCILGNRPAMNIKASDAKSISFDLDCNCGISDKESHMHAMSIRFDDADTITTSCKAIINGQTAPDHETVLKRVKANSASVN